MTSDELLNHLRDIDLRLYSARVQLFLHSLPLDVQKRLVSYREEISLLEGKLSNAQLAVIAGKLEELSEDLKAGISNLQREIDKLNNAIAIIDTISSVLGLVARVVSLGLP